MATFATQGNFFSFCSLANNLTHLEGKKDFKIRWVMDTGANAHVCIARSDFFHYTAMASLPGVQTGGAICVSIGYGSVRRTVVRSDGSTYTFDLHNVLHSPDFFTNVISHTRMKEGGAYYHGFDDTVRLCSTHEEIAMTPVIDGLNTFLCVKDESEVPAMMAFVALSAKRYQAPPVKKATLYEWHCILGHISYDKVKLLEQNSVGMVITDSRRPDCSTCGLSKSIKIISRRPQERSRRLFQLVHVDMVGPIEPQAFPKHEQYWLLFTEDLTRH